MWRASPFAAPPSTTSSSPSPPRPDRSPSMSETLTLTARCLRLSRRQIDALLTSLLLPVLLMVMFVELFGGAIHTGTSYVSYVVPGVLVLCAGFGSTLTAVAV